MKTARIRTSNYKSAAGVPPPPLPSAAKAEAFVVGNPARSFGV
jgi:hypothetical protein